MKNFSFKKFEMALMTYLLAVPSFVYAGGTTSYTKPIFGCRSDANPLGCWTDAAFSWSQGAILVLAVAVIIVAGTIYMTSAGNPARIGYAKKLIYGALTGVAIIVLGKFFVTKVIGLTI